MNGTLLKVRIIDSDLNWDVYETDENQNFGIKSCK